MSGVKLGKLDIRIYGHDDVQAVRVRVVGGSIPTELGAQVTLEVVGVLRRVNWEEVEIERDPV